MLFSRHALLLFFHLLLLYQPLVASCQGLAVQDLALLVDAGGSETIESVASAEAAGKFRPLTYGLNAGYTRNIHWLRFTVQVPTAGEWWMEVQPPFLDDIRLFEPLPVAPGAKPSYREQRGGDSRPFAEREIPYRAFVARLDLPDTQPRAYYLRIQTSSTTMAFPRLWQPRDFQQAVVLEYVVLGLFYGLLAAVLISNLVHWYWLRDALYGYFSLYVLAIVLLFFGANGFVGQFLFANHPQIADLWVGIFIFLGFSAATPFFQRMLRVDHRRPWLFRYFRLHIALPLLLLPSVFTGYFIDAMRFLLADMIIAIGVCFWLAYGIWRQGGRDGMFLITSLAISLLGAAPVFMFMLGILPGAAWLLHSRQITTFGGILAMHIAIATRIRDTEIAHREALIRVRQAEIRVEQETLAQDEHRQFISMLTHELRTPLAVIDGAVQSLEYLHQDDETRLRFRRIRRSVGRINGLVKQFLAKDRIDDARLTIRPVPLDGADLARLALQSCTEGAIERVRLEIPDVALPCRGDVALVQVALVNLLDNALKYSPPDSPVELQVEAMENQGTAGVAWTVSDQGAGFTPENWEAVFGKYVRGAGHGHVAGAGLGLYLVRRIAELHGGSVAVLEREDWGATLRFWLPREGGR